MPSHKSGQTLFSHLRGNDTESKACQPSWRCLWLDFWFHGMMPLALTGGTSLTAPLGMSFVGFVATHTWQHVAAQCLHVKHSTNSEEWKNEWVNTWRNSRTGAPWPSGTWHWALSSSSTLASSCLYSGGGWRCEGGLGTLSTQPVHPGCSCAHSLLPTPLPYEPYVSCEFPLSREF